MKLVILSTRTPHHTYFIDRLADEFEIAGVFYETKRHQAKFPTGPLFEEEEAAFEARHFARSAPSVSVPEHEVGTVNDPGVAERIAALGADVGVVFGCGKIKPHVFKAAKAGLINVHRGVSEKYRGLDSDLWAIERQDEANIGVTIHRVDEELDTGEIYRCATLPNHASIQTHQIRCFTTILAAELVLETLRDYRAKGRLSGRPQAKGDYFSFMPLETKKEVRKRFDASHARPEDAAYQADLFCFEKRHADQLCILLYHGVTRSSGPGIENFSRKHLEAEVFERQMALIAKGCTLLSMDEVAKLCAAKKPFPPKSVAVTFDDAFENVASVAYPIMKKHGVPFTFYVSTGFVDTDRMFWVDVIEDCVNRSKVDRLDLPDFKASIGTEAERMDAVRKLKRLCKSVDNARKDAIIAELAKQTGVTPASKGGPNYGMVTWKQLADMAKDPLCIVGSHSHSHNVLSQISPEVLRDEVGRSLKILTERLGRPTLHFSYPEGRPEHYNEAVIRELKSHGVICSPSAICGLNPAGADPFHLRRVMVGFDGMPFPYEDARLNPRELSVV